MSSEVWVIWAGVSALSVPKPVPQPQWAGGAHRLPRALAKVYAWLLFRYREGAAGVSSRMGAGADALNSLEVSLSNVLEEGKQALGLSLPELRGWAFL